MAAVSSDGGTQNVRTNNIIDERQFAEWRLQCIAAMKDKMESNLRARSRRVEEVVNERIDRLHRELQIDTENLQKYRFAIPEDVMAQSLWSMSHRLEGWNGVRIVSCKRIPRCFASYHLIGENWWNRQKGSWFGDFYFLPLFQCIGSFCETLNVSEYTQYSDLLFIHILSAVMESNITFKRSRPQPLCPDQSLQKSLELKRFFGGLLGVEMTEKSVAKIRRVVMDRITELKEQRFTEFIRFRNENGNRSLNLNENLSGNLNGNRNGNDSQNRNQQKRTEFESVSAQSIAPNFRPPTNCQIDSTQHDQRSIASTLSVNHSLTDTVSLNYSLSDTTTSSMNHSLADTVSSTDSRSPFSFDTFPPISQSQIMETDALIRDDIASHSVIEYKDRAPNYHQFDGSNYPNRSMSSSFGLDFEPGPFGLNPFNPLRETEVGLFGGGEYQFCGDEMDEDALFPMTPHLNSSFFSF